MRRIAGVVMALGVSVVPAIAARAQSDASVAVQDNYFTPAEIHIVVGDTVTWTDLGGPHSVTSDDGTSFDSNPGCIAGLGCMASGDTFSHQFRTAETISYHCRVHGTSMIGRVVVEPAATTTSSTASTTTTTEATTTTASDASAAPGSGQPTTVTQFPLPSLPTSPRSAALPRAISGSSREDDIRPWALLAVALAGSTTVAGVILVRKGRVPFG